MPADDVHEDPHALSPELVLVSSPEETKDARAQLAQSPWESSSSTGEPQPANAAAGDGRRFWSRRKLLVAGLVALAVIGLGAIGYVAASRDDGGATAKSTFVPSRTWAWAPTQGATAYDVTFVRDGQVVFRTRASEPRVVLPPSFRFEQGSYRWTVRALPVTAGAPPIVDSTFSLTPAGAAEANDSAR
jgi:hypothetical protein